MPYHKDLDGADEKSLGDKKIGTTKRGIGPCYQDKMGRKGIRMQDLLDEKIFRLKLEAVLAQKNPILEKIYGLHTYTVEEICDEYLPYARILAPYVCEIGPYAERGAGRWASPSSSKAPRARCSTSTMAPIPFVTSSSCCAGGASTGTGVGPKAIDRVLGIQKAYITRVGEGPFPTELKFPENGGTGQDAEDGEPLCAAGHEFGVTTGRKRRCGWFDAVIGRYAAEVNGLTDVALTKLDVLSAFDTIKVCVAYECDGVRYDYFPMQQSRCCTTRSPFTWSCPAGKTRTSPVAAPTRSCRRTRASYVEYLEEVCRRAHEHHLGWPRSRPDDYPHVLVEGRVAFTCCPGASPREGCRAQTDAKCAHPIPARGIVGRTSHNCARHPSRGDAPYAKKQLAAKRGKERT